jgi:hypothetical protein
MRPRDWWERDDTTIGNISSCSCDILSTLLYTSPFCYRNATCSTATNTPSGSYQRAVTLLRLSTQSRHSHPTSIACRHPQIPAWPQASDKNDDCSPHRRCAHKGGFGRSWTPSIRRLTSASPLPVQPIAVWLGRYGVPGTLSALSDPMPLGSLKNALHPRLGLDLCMPFLLVLEQQSPLHVSSVWSEDTI